MAEKVKKEKKKVYAPDCFVCKGTGKFVFTYEDANGKKTVSDRECDCHLFYTKVK